MGFLARRDHVAEIIQFAAERSAALLVCGELFFAKIAEQFLKSLPFPGIFPAFLLFLFGWL